MVSAPAPSRSESRGRAARFLGYLRAHPILLLLLLTPGIPEYLSTSSSLRGLLIAPPIFFLFLALNLGLYGPGVLLIREAMIRWRKGWASVIALGAAYGILEEGIALSTLSNPHAGPVGALGFYGHWAGVSWVWTVGVLMVHIVFSIALPILLLGLALPETRGRSLVSRKGIYTLFGVLSLDVVVLLLAIVFGEHFWMGSGVLVGSVLAIGVLVAIAYRLPANLLRPAHELRSWPLWVFGLFGFILLVGTFLVEGVLGFYRAPAVVTMAALVALYAGMLWGTLTHVGRQGIERPMLAFATGALACIAAFGFIAAFPVPVVVVADVLVVLFLRHLWRRYSGAPLVGAPGVPTGAREPQDRPSAG